MNLDGKQHPLVLERAHDHLFHDGKMKQNAPGSAEKIDDWHRRSFNPPSVSELTGPALQGDIQLGHGKSPTEGGLRDEEDAGLILSVRGFLGCGILTSPANG